MTYTATRYHDFSAGHRVAGHENKCANLHGHNYRVHFHCCPEREKIDARVFNEPSQITEGLYSLDDVGRVIDFGEIKTRLCQWLEDNWDHKMLLWREDDLMVTQIQAGPHDVPGIVIVPFNPTAENMARYLVEEVGPDQLKGTGVELIKVVVEETRKCSAAYKKE